MKIIISNNGGIRMKEVRTIIWDLDETVWFFREDEVDIICKKLNIIYNERFRQEYYKMWEDIYFYFKDKIVTYNEMKQFIEKEMPILKLCHISVDELLKVIFESKKDLVIVNQEAIEIMKYFSEKGLKNISITDGFAQYQQRVLQELNALIYIEKIYGCGNAYIKNSIGKVTQMIEELELENRREEFVMIGDSLSNDIFFAQKLGIKSIWYNPKGKTNETSYIPTLEVSSLLELKGIF